MKSIMSKGSSARDLSVFESEWFESRDDIKEQKSLKSVLLNSLQKSSVYAVSQLVTSSGFGRRILWFLVLLVGLCGCSYEIYHFLTLYFQYPVVITLEVKNNWKLDFPAVTVCNLNRISNHNYRCILLGVSPEKCQGSKKIRPLITERKKFASCSKEFDGTFSAERSRILTFLNRYLQTDEGNRSKYGYSKIDLLSSCTFNGETCSIRDFSFYHFINVESNLQRMKSFTFEHDVIENVHSFSSQKLNFTEFPSIQFGNCFTFNGMRNKDGKPLQTPYIGPNSGLEISLSLSSHAYSPITSSIGARVIIHEYDVEPNPEDNGINISPGYETSVAIQQTSIYRLPEPYRDKCRQYKGEKPSERSQASCITNCMQNVNLYQCGCMDPFLPTEVSMPLCDLRNQSTVCCLDDVMKQFSEDNVSCSCPLPCKTTDYEMTISTAEWPSERFFKEFLKEDFENKRNVHMKKAKNVMKTFLINSLHNENNITEGNATELNTTFTKKSNDRCKGSTCPSSLELFKDHREDMAKLKVFYKSLEKISYKQEPMFQDSELFSQLGGQLGLWLGISLVALFECIENITHLIHYLLKKMVKPKQMNTSALQNSECLKISTV